MMRKDTIVGLLILIAIFFLSVLTKLEFNGSLEPKVGEKLESKVRVVDGDTIELESEMVRLFGIDAPEINQTCMQKGEEIQCGQDSKKFLQSIVLKGEVTCSHQSKDRWGRNISICKVGTEDIGSLMVKGGWAIAYRKYSSLYSEQENFARVNDLGIWNKDFLPPSEWRKLRNK